VGSQENTINNFGLLIAYVLPGFTAIQGLPFLAGDSTAWGSVDGVARATLPGFLSGTVAALAAGLTVSTLRWLVIDTLHHRTGIHPPRWDFSLLEKNITAFELLVQSHYRYYKFYSNMVVALIFSYAWKGYLLGWRGLIYWCLATLFFLASRDALKKYYERAGRLLESTKPQAIFICER
jgi:hypothetical protein